MKPYIKEIPDKELIDKITELCGSFHIGSLEFDAGDILYELDPTAFNCWKSEEDTIWICSECETEYNSESDAEECCRKEAIDFIGFNVSELSEEEQELVNSFEEISICDKCGLITQDIDILDLELIDENDNNKIALSKQGYCKVCEKCLYNKKGN